MSIWKDFLFCIFSVSSKLLPKKCTHFANKFLLVKKKNVLFALKKKEAGNTNTRMLSPCASG